MREELRAIQLRVVRNFPYLARPEFQLFGIALVVRLIFVLLYPGLSYYGGISGEYLDVVQSVRTGHGFTQYVDIAPYTAPLSHWSYEPFVARPIGYVLFLLLPSYIFGISIVGFQIVQALFTAFSAVLVYKLALLVFEQFENSGKIALWSGMLAAVWPNQARFEIALLPDGLTTLVMLGFAYYLTKFYVTRQHAFLLIAALILGLSIFLRPDLVLFAPFFFVLLIVKIGWKKALADTMLLVAPLILLVGLNTWKNYAWSGEIVPLNLGSGTTMYEGISQFGDTLGTTYADERVAHEKLNTRNLFYPDGPRHDQMLFQIAVDTIKNHPWFYAKLIIKRVPLMFTVRGLYFSDTLSLSDSKNDLANRFPQKYIQMLRTRPAEAAARVFSPLLGWLLVLCGFYSLVRTAKREEGTHSAMIALLLFYFISSHLVTNVEPRYFYPAIPLLMPYAALLVNELRGRRTQRSIEAGRPTATKTQ